MADRTPLTPEERQEVMAQDVPAPVRLAAYMPAGRAFHEFHRVETALAHMHELGLLPLELYQRILDHRLSYRYYAPVATAPDVIKALSEAKNPTPLLAMISQTVGARKLGERVLPIRREDVPGMDTRTMEELIQEPLVKKRLSFDAGLEIVRQLAKRRAAAGLGQEAEVEKLLAAARTLEEQLRTLGVV